MRWNFNGMEIPLKQLHIMVDSIKYGCMKMVFNYISWDFYITGVFGNLEIMKFLLEKKCPCMEWRYISERSRARLS